MLLAAIMPLAVYASDSEEVTKVSENQINGSKTVVVYFSCTNTTKGIAEKIAVTLNGDIWCITPEQPYTSADLNYNDNSCRANREQNDGSARPAIKDMIDLSKYEVLYVGYPIWWGKLPKILWTFFETYDLSGKTVIPFCTSGSSGISTSVREIHGLEPNATVLYGRRFEGGADLQTVMNWVNSVQPQTASISVVNLPEKLPSKPSVLTVLCRNPT